MNNIWKSLIRSNYTVFLLLGIALVLRILTLDRVSLWQDEMISVTHAMQAPLDLIWNVMTADKHPPLYFLQLKAWMTLSSSDIWLRINSLAWGLAAVFSLYWTVNRRNGRELAIIAALIFALLPAAVFYSHEVRMYTMLMTLVVWGWYANELYAGKINLEDRNRKLALIALIELSIIYSHAIGFFTVFFLVLYTATLFLTNFNKKIVVPWLIVQFLIALLSLPIVGVALIGSSSSSSMDGGTQIIKGLTAILSGLPFADNLYIQICSLTIFAIAMYIAWKVSDSKKLIVVMVILPIVVTILISATVKPMFKARTLTFVLPFLSIGLAYGIVQFHHWLAEKQYSTAVSLVLLSVGFLYIFLANSGIRMHPTHHDFRSAVSYIQKSYDPGDVLITERLGLLWGVAWYLQGPDWGKPLYIRGGQSDIKKKLINKIGKEWARYLGFVETEDNLTVSGYRIFVGDQWWNEVKNQPSINIVQFSTDNVTLPESAHDFCLESTRNFKGLSVSRYVKSATKSCK